MLQSRHRRVAEMTCQGHLQADLFLLHVPKFISKRYKIGKDANNVDNELDATVTVY